MSVRNDLVVALVQAHTQNDGDQFAKVVAQIEGGATADFARALRRASTTDGVRMVALHQDQKGLVEQTIPREGLAALTLNERIAAALGAVLREHARQDALIAAGFEPARRLLFVGPPGTGKTSCAAALAAELRLPLISVRIAGLISDTMGTTAKKVREVCAVLRHSRAVVLLDEIDAVGRSRAGGLVDSAAGREYAVTINTLLQELDSANGSQGVLVACTNLPDALDPALVRRFDATLRFDLPTPAEAARVAEAICSRVVVASGMDWARVGAAAVANGKSHADVVAIVRRAAKAVVLADSQLCTGDLLHALSEGA